MPLTSRVPPTQRPLTPPTSRGGGFMGPHSLHTPHRPSPARRTINQSLPPPGWFNDHVDMSFVAVITQECNAKKRPREDEPDMVSTTVHMDTFIVNAVNAHQAVFNVLEAVITQECNEKKRPREDEPDMVSTTVHMDASIANAVNAHHAVFNVLKTEDDLQVWLEEILCARDGMTLVAKEWEVVKGRPKATSCFVLTESR